MTMASQINVCTPFSHCEKTMQVILLFCFVLFAPVCVRDVYMLVCMCAYLAAAVVEQLPGLIII